MCELHQTDHTLLRHYRDDDIDNDKPGPESKESTSNNGATHVAGRTLQSMKRPPPPIRLNAGGPAFVDSNGNQWASDDAYMIATGRTWKTSHTIENTPQEDQILYQTERRQKDGKTLKYVIDVPKDWHAYDVKLHFAENWARQRRERVLALWVQGKRLSYGPYERIDVYERTGGRYRPFVLNHRAVVDDGKLVVSVQPLVQNAKLNGIEVIPTVFGHPAIPSCIRHDVDFSFTDGGNKLEHGDFVSNEWETFGMLLSAIGGFDTRPRLFNTSDTVGSYLGTPNMQCNSTGPGVGLGGEPDGNGPNCQSPGNVLIIQDPDNAYPSANTEGGTITFKFPNLVNIDIDREGVAIGLLNIASKTSITLVVKNKGAGYRKLPPFDVPILGNNSFQVVPINEKRVRKIQVNLSSPGAVTSISFCGEPWLDFDQCIFHCPSHYCSYSDQEAEYNLTCAECNPRTNEWCDEKSICRSRYNTYLDISYSPTCHLKPGESCSAEGPECESFICDTTTKTCLECSPFFIDPFTGEVEAHHRCIHSDHRFEPCTLVDNTYKCLKGSGYYVTYRRDDPNEYFLISEADANAMYQDCEINNTNVILMDIFKAPIVLCPNRSFEKREDVYYYELSNNENITVNCGTGAGIPEKYGTRCRVVYRFPIEKNSVYPPLLGKGTYCTTHSQCESRSCKTSQLNSRLSICQ